VFGLNRHQTLQTAEPDFRQTFCHRMVTSQKGTDTVLQNLRFEP
jgi:hypothetical protein